VSWRSCGCNGENSGCERDHDEVTVVANVVVNVRTLVVKVRRS
jgi:hypothetical protein